VRIRIALIDDHPVVLGGLDAALGSIDDLVVVAHAQSVREGRQVLGRVDVDVALLDIRLPDGNGLQLLQELGPDRRPAVIILSSFLTTQYVAASVRFGAQGFVLKTAPLPELIEAIRRVAAGGSAFTAEQLREGNSGYVSLTPRERDVLRLVIRGRSNEEIGAEIKASRKTVEAHLSRLYERYGIRGGRIELAIRAEREGWLDVGPAPSGRDPVHHEGGPEHC
jgi:DNA-binding NarL/FixJ family response regulator